ncbi:hypothetical protein K461DRAFT_313624 [Myriangium duriaei CBS 260.36]|uniref:Uncharacterized protein n=1 Tax=Myriangium duriaei CBS 260.36 TaxID=1168546 RepID=A0A9P4MF03_9PEZI|nr:hypothetical protein K461DRAFT_313624 [Myriangium duriaei CBS 260.36]
MAAAHDWASSTVYNNNNASANDPSSASPQQDDAPDDPKARLRSIPPWIITPDLRDKQQAPQPPPLLQPQTPVIPHHQYLPEAQRGRTARGRRWDHLRDAEPAMLDQTLEQSSARWLTFMLSGPQYRPSETNGATMMPDEWMEENVPFWTADQQMMEEHEQREKHRSFLLDVARRRGSINKAKGTILKNPFVPLLFRTITAAFTLAALGLSAQVYHQTRAANRTESCRQRASTYIALAVDAVAIPYIIYITRDEYTSKPLGLRSATAKTSLLLVDLYFIVFYSSTLSLAFDALTDSRWACYSAGNSTCIQSSSICKSQTGLVAVLLVALVAWIVTFSISVLRVVKRLRPDE